MDVISYPNHNPNTGLAIFCKRGPMNFIQAAMITYIMVRFSRKMEIRSTQVS